MVADSSSTEEIAALHRRISRDLAELRLRLRRGAIQAETVPGDLLVAAIKVARNLGLGPVISQRSGIAWIAGLGAAAGLVVGRHLRARSSGSRQARGL